MALNGRNEARTGESEREEQCMLLADWLANGVKATATKVELIGGWTSGKEETRTAAVQSVAPDPDDDNGNFGTIESKQQCGMTIRKTTTKENTFHILQKR